MTIKRQNKYFITVEDTHGHIFEVPAYANTIDDIITLIENYYEANEFKVHRIRPDYQYNKLINQKEVS